MKKTLNIMSICGITLARATVWLKNKFSTGQTTWQPKQQSSNKLRRAWVANILNGRSGLPMIHLKKEQKWGIH